jgi:hypothetical protein
VTTPNQGAPDGAVTVGGGMWNFGQLMSEKQGRQQFELDPPTNLVEALEILPVVLSQLPGDAMKPWQKWLDLTDEDVFNGNVIQEFIDSLTDSPLTLVIADVKETIDGMIRGLVGWVESGYTPAQVEAAAKDLASTVADIRAIVTALISAKGYAGTARVIDFNGQADSSTLGAEWSQIYFSGSGTGTLGLSNGRVKWLGSADQRWCSARYIGAETKGDYQKIGVAFSTKPSRDILGGAKSVNRIAGRVSDDQQSFVAVDFTADGFILGCQVGGSWTTWYSRVSTLFSPWEFKAGAAYWLECGTTGGARIYRVWENNKILHTHVESAATSNLGVGFRSVGVAVKAFSDTQLPGQVAAFAFYDNQAALKMGSGWRISRTSGSTADLSNGENNFPSNWFDTPDYITDDLVYDTTNNRITVAATGWYQITVKQHGDSSLIGGFSVQPTLLVNNSVVMRGQNFRWSGYNNGFAHSFIVYVTEGDTVKPGYWASATALAQLGGGDASGFNTYWSGVYLGTNKKLPITEEA